MAAEIPAFAAAGQGGQEQAVDGNSGTDTQEREKEQDAVQGNAAGTQREVTQESIDSTREQIQASQAQRKEIEDNITDLEQTRKELEQSKEDLTAYVTDLDAQLTSIQTRISTLEEQILEGHQKIAQTASQLQEAKRAQQEQYNNMKKRIQFIYESGDTYMLEALIDSGSLSEMLNKATYINALSAYDADLLEKYQKQTQLVQVTQAALEEEQRTLEAARDGLASEQSSMQQLVEDKRSQLSEVSSDIEQQQLSIDAYEQQMADQDAEIAALEQQVSDDEATLRQQEERRRAEEEAKRKAEEEERQQAEEEARRKAAEEEARQKAEEASSSADTDSSGTDGSDSNDNTGSTSGTDTSSDGSAFVSGDQTAYGSNSGYRYSGGQFTWPAPSSTGITSPYGNRFHPIYKVNRFHSGLDIAAPMGSPIVAAADGVVVAAAYNSSMGNYVMIDHGDGLFTIYMHASQLEVVKGDAVTAGTEIAKVGSTGASTGPHLHFSVRKNGQYVDPGTYLGTLGQVSVDEETAAQATD